MTAGALSAYLEAALDCVIMADASGRVLEFNPAAERTFGYSRDQALGRTLPELIVPPALRERHQRAFERFVETRDQKVFGQRLELIGMRADGSEFPVELVLSQVEGEPLLICGALRDLSDAKRREDDLRTLADEQAALRRVATLVARQPAPAEVFAAVTKEAANLLSSPLVSMVRYEPDATATVIAALDEHPFPLGSNWTLDGPSIVASVLETGSPARVDDYARIPGGIAERIRKAGIHSAVGVPITVEGAIWGAMVAVAPGTQPLPEGTELRLANFTELVAAAIANAQAREDLRGLADEQAALKRLAMLVASGADSATVFDAVCVETGRLLGASSVNLVRFTRGGLVETTAAWSLRDRPVPTGTRLPVEPNSIAALIQRTAAPGRSGLTTSEDRFRTLVEQLPLVAYVRGVGVFESNAYVSPQVEDMLGYSAQEWESDPALLERVVHPEDRDHVIAEASRVRETNEPFRLEYRMVARDGHAVWVYDEMHLVRDADGHPRGVVGVLLDVSGEKAAETAGASAQDSIAKSEQKFRSIVETANEWIWAEDERGGLAYTNPAVYEMLGYTYEGGAGELAVLLRQRGIRSEVGAPVVVDGRVWGALIAGTDEAEPLPPGTERRLASFTDLVTTAISRIQARDDLRDLAEEQAALRRVATLVAEGAPRADVFAAVAREVAGVLNLELVELSRYESEEVATVLGCFGEHAFQVGTSWPLDGGSLTARVWRSGQPERIDDYTNLAGVTARAAYESGVRAGVAVPIVVEGATWGVIAAGSTSDPVPAGTEERLTDFTELVATAVLNTQARQDLQQLVAEQASLRHVATLVALETPPEELFAAVAEEVARFVDVPVIGIARYEADGTATAMGSWGPVPFPAGMSIAPHPGAIAEVRRTGRLAHVSSYADLGDDVSAGLVADAGIQSGLGVPIEVGGRLWGVMLALSTAAKPLPEGLEGRLAVFTELVATAISNAEARNDLRRLAAQHAALRRVATLVAEAATPDAVFAAVATEVHSVLGLPTMLVRLDPDGYSTEVAESGGANPYPFGTTFPPHPGVIAMVSESGRPERVDDYAEIPGEDAAFVRASGIHSSVGAPITVDGKTWGLAIVLAREPLPADTEARLLEFAELVATAISNTQARADVNQLLEEQAALRRLATQIARGADPHDVFATVCEEAGRLLGASSTNLAHFTADGFNLTMAGWSLRDTHVPTGTRLPLDADSINSQIRRSVAPSRFDRYDSIAGELAALIRQRGIRSEVGAPVIVEGKVWGALIAGSDSAEPLPVGTELRVARFAELIATSVSNATARSELIASRARIVAASDEARRRIERNLHDGTQQRLVALGLDLQAVRAGIGPDQTEVRSGLERAGREIDAVLDDVRELSRGLHPALLSQGGLGPALRALARRSPIHVNLDLDVERRPPEPIEIAVYYVVSEALTNAAKHSDASEISVTVAVMNTSLHSTIEDNGLGGADPSAGSGLIGLIDRVEALGGRFMLDSPPNEGTRIAIELPLVAHPTEISAGGPKSGAAEPE